MIWIYDFEQRHFFVLQSLDWLNVFAGSCLSHTITFRPLQLFFPVSFAIRFINPDLGLRFLTFSSICSSIMVANSQIVSYYICSIHFSNPPPNCFPRRFGFRLIHIRFECYLSKKFPVFFSSVTFKKL